MSTGKNGTPERKFSVSEEHINQWINDYNFIFSCKVTRIWQRLGQLLGFRVSPGPISYHLLGPEPPISTSQGSSHVGQTISLFTLKAPRVWLHNLRSTDPRPWPFLLKEAPQGTQTVYIYSLEDGGYDLRQLQGGLLVLNRGRKVHMFNL